MEQNGQAPAVRLPIDREHPLVVNEKPLKVWMKLDAPQSPALDVVHFPLDVSDVLVPCSQTNKLRILLALFLDKLVDRANLLHLRGYRAHQKAVDAGFASPLGQNVRKTHVLHGDVVEIPHRVSGLFRNFSRIDMGVGVRRPVGDAVVMHRHFTDPSFPVSLSAAGPLKKRSHSNPGGINQTPWKAPRSVYSHPSS